MEQQHRICQTCGVSLSPDAQFCQECGYAVDPKLRTEESEVAVRRNLTYSSDFVSLLKKSAWTKILLVAYIASVLFASLATWMEISLLQNIEFATDSEISNNESIVGLSSLITLFVLLGFIITFLMWLHRASSNLASLGYVNQRFSPGWAVGWWFIPIMNLFRPFLVMKEIWKASHPENNRLSKPESANRLMYQKDELSSDLIGWWWGFWLVSNWIGNAALRGYFRADTAEQLIISNSVQLFVSGADIVAAIMLFLIVNQITNNQEIKSQTVSN